MTGITPLATAGVSGVHAVRAVSTATLARPAAGSTEHQDTILTCDRGPRVLPAGRTAGYQLTKRLAPLECAPGRWRLADLQRLDAERAATALQTLLVDGDPVTAPVDQPEPALPAPRRGGRRKQEA